MTGRRDMTILIYSVLFFARRLLFSIFVVYFPDFTWLQLFLYSLFCLTTIAYVFIVWPFRSEFMNQMEIFNEFTNLCMFYHFFFYTDFVPYPSKRYTAGYFQMFFFGCFMSVHIAILLTEQIKSLYHLLRRYHFEKKRKRVDKNDHCRGKV